jgi:hypothetical protein
VTFVSYCFGDLGVHLSNGADAELAVGFSLISPDGRLVLAPLNPGETKDWTVQPPWANNFVVKIGLLPGTVFATGVWQAQGCSDPSPGTRLPPAPLDPPNSYRTVPPGPGPQVVASGTGNTAGHINPPAPAPGEAANGNGGGGTSGSGLALVVTGATATGLVGAGIGSALVIFVRRRRVRLADLNAPPELRRPRDVSLGDTPS